MATTSAIVLAAGLGTRMKSALPKALHRIAGRPLCHFPVHAALDAGCDEVVVVVGHGKDLVAASLAEAFGERVKIAVQEQQLGTGDAARAGLAVVSPTCTRVLIVNGDAPLVSAEHLQELMQYTGVLTLATCILAEPEGYGRIVRRGDEVVAIREQKDLREGEAGIFEINPGIYLGDAVFLREVLPKLEANNAQREYYLTDVVEHAVRSGHSVRGVALPSEVMIGVNDRDQLMNAEIVLYTQIAKRWRHAGVTVHGAARIQLSVTIEADAEIETGVSLRGATRIGAGARIDVGCVLTDVVVAAGAYLKPYTVAEASSIGEGAQVGPFSHLRPGSELGAEVHIGNFVETKKTTIGRGSKANHLAYLGDGVIGARVNVGAGTIFCNYDGVRKHITVLEDDVFIGSDSQLVAPVTVRRGATLGAGTTLTKDAPAGKLTLSRAKQMTLDGWQRPVKQAKK